MGGGFQFGVVSHWAFRPPPTLLRAVQALMRERAVSLQVICRSW